MCASGQFAATKGTCSRAKSHAPPTAAMVTTIWTQKRFDTLWLSKIWWISGTSSPAMWNVFRSISRAALATFRMLTPHALSRSFGLRLDLNAMNEKEAMTETEMRYSRTKRLDGCWWGCIVARARSAGRQVQRAALEDRCKLGRPLSARTSPRVSRVFPWICGFRRLCALTVTSKSRLPVDANLASYRPGSWLSRTPSSLAGERTTRRCQAPENHENGIKFWATVSSKV